MEGLRQALHKSETDPIKAVLTANLRDQMEKYFWRNEHIDHQMMAKSSFLSPESAIRLPEDVIADVVDLIKKDADLQLIPEIDSGSPNQPL